MASPSAYHGVVLSFWAGLATGFGGMFSVLLMDSFNEKGVNSVLPFSLALAAGVMITVSVVDLWYPLVLKDTKDGIFLPTLFVIIGGICFKFLSRSLNLVFPTHSTTPLPLTHEKLNSPTVMTQQRNLKVAGMMFLALTLHNFPEGLAVSISSAASEELGATLAIAVAFHNGPEGMAISAPYYAATNSRIKAILLAFLSGLTEPLGAIVALFALGPFLKMNPSFVHYILCLVAGIMIASSVIELIPESKSYGRFDLVAFGYITGTLTMLMTIYYL